MRDSTTNDITHVLSPPLFRDPTSNIRCVIAAAAQPPLCVKPPSIVCISVPKPTTRVQREESSREPFCGHCNSQQGHQHATQTHQNRRLLPICNHDDHRRDQKNPMCRPAVTHRKGFAQRKQSAARGGFTKERALVQADDEASASPMHLSAKLASKQSVHPRTWMYQNNQQELHVQPACLGPASAISA